MQALWLYRCKLAPPSLGMRELSLNRILDIGARGLGGKNEK
jgi:hypothetical protein